MKRSGIALALCTALLALAPLGHRAGAGVLSTLLSPGNCPDTDVADFMDDPDAFASADDKPCKALCKRAVAECKQFAKGAVSCLAGVAKSDLRYSLENCALISATPQDLKACKAAAAANYRANKSAAQDDLPPAFDHCKSWGDDCVSSCEGAPL